jgi:hypothetical protein
VAEFSGQKPEKFKIILDKSKSDFRIGEGYPLEFFYHMTHFHRIGFQKIPSCGTLKKRFLTEIEVPSVQDIGSCFLTSEPSITIKSLIQHLFAWFSFPPEPQLLWRQELPPKAECPDGKQVFCIFDFGGGMPFKTHPGISH